MFVSTSVVLFVQLIILCVFFLSGTYPSSLLKKSREINVAFRIKISNTCIHSLSQTPAIHIICISVSQMKEQWLQAFLRWAMSKLISAVESEDELIISKSTDFRLCAEQRQPVCAAAAVQDVWLSTAYRIKRVKNRERQPDRKSYLWPDCFDCFLLFKWWNVACDWCSLFLNEKSNIPQN